LAGAAPQRTLVGDSGDRDHPHKQLHRSPFHAQLGVTTVTYVEVIEASAACRSE
jgi:hypothetical protein